MIKNPYHKSVYGVGYLGEGIHKVKDKGVHTKAYNVWLSMLMRCYSSKYQEGNPTYKECFVTAEWHNFQNFAEWYYQQPNSEKDGFHLDKDLIILGNKVYGPETCSIVPYQINTLISDSRSARGDWPQGVYHHTPSNKYVAKMNTGERSRKQKYLGLYETPEEAFAVYKREKEKFIKEQSEKYKELLHPKVYENLMSYEVKPA